MTDTFRVRIDDFKGVARDVAPGKPTPALFQRDEGGDLFQRGSWRVRRGQSKLLMNPGTGAVRTIFAFETPAQTLSLIVIDEAGNFRGFAYLASTGAPVGATDLEGFGVEGFGEGGFGDGA